jgi:hypothetical protein
VRKRKHWRRQATVRADAEPRQAEAQTGAAATATGKVSFARRAAGWRGIVLDLAVVAANLFLLAPLARLLRAGGQGFLAPTQDWGKNVSPTVGWLFLSVFAAHALGAYLKRLPRQARLSAQKAGGEVARPAQEAARLTGVSERTRRRRLLQLAPRMQRSPKNFVVVVVCALLLAHFFIFMSLLFTGWQSTPLDSWSPLFGHKPGDSSFREFIVRFVLIVGVMPLPTFLVALSLGGGADADDAAPPPATWRAHWATELLADLFLYFSIIVLTLVLNVLIAPRFASAQALPDATFGDVLASLVPLALAFSIIYLPPRLVYLVEDYKSLPAWLTILLALLTLAYRTFFPDQTFAW